MRLAVTEAGRATLTPESDADAEIVDRIAAGDREAFTDLYVRHRLPLFHYIVQLTSDRGLAEEVLQDTFVVVWQQAHVFERRSRVQAWLFGIARRRLWKAMRRTAPDLVDSEVLETLEAPDPDPEQAVLSAAEHESVAAAIERLSSVHREILLLSYVHELTYQELAVVLGVPIGTVKSRLSNAKRALRALLATIEDER